MEREETEETINPKAITPEPLEDPEPSVEEKIASMTVSQQDALEDKTIEEKLEKESLEKPAESEENETEIDQAKNNEDEPRKSEDSLSYNWTASAKLLCEAIKEYQPTEAYENFTKGCQWSPDGTCLLVPSEDFRVRIYELPRELYSEKIPSDLSSDTFSPALTIKEGGLIYDTCWYPFMNSWEPSTCCFLTTSRESPIHLWDAFNGQLRSTYRAYNQVDEVEASISIQFVDSGREIWAALKMR